LLWRYGKADSDQGARRYGPRNTCCADKSEIRRLSSKAVLGILSSFPRKPMINKVEANFVPHNLHTEIALFGVQMWDT
jgi:hypothetical protein